MPMASSVLISPGPNTVTMAMARIRLGNASRISMKPIKTLSVQPPT